MKLILTLLVRDEIDIIEYMLEYHFNHGVDVIIATDNGSKDGTLEVLEKYKRMDKLELIIEPPSDFSQHRWVSKMANIAYEKYHADWVINADADEIFVLDGPNNNLKQYFDSIPEDVSIVQITRHDFVPFQRPMNLSPFVEMIYRKRISKNLHGHPLPMKVVHRGSPNTIISQGNHDASGSFLGKSGLAERLFVYHYPIRSYNQFYSKVINGGSGYAKNKELDLSQGLHKRTWYGHLLNGRLKEVYKKECFFDQQKLQAAIVDNEIIEDFTVANYFYANPINH